MCGIAGLFVTPDRALDNLESVAGQMGAAIRHRGPDAAGTVAVGGYAALAHQRLSIIDLSDNGKQPMRSGDGRWYMVYNGECYNYQSLRATLDAERNIQWRSGNDAEVVLEAIAAWGITRALEMMNGMFALAVIDGQLRHLYLARDRMGKKPLYLATTNNGIAFGSELRALMAVPGFERAVDPAALYAFLTLGYVPESTAIFERVRKVLPGTFERYRLDDAQCVQHDLTKRFWNLDEFAIPVDSSDEGVLDDKLEQLLLDAVGSRLIADVPVGCLLSGGIDSSLITALAVKQNQGLQRIRTFCVGFKNPTFNESEFARAVARHLDTDHTQIVLDETEALETVTKLPLIYDEPFADASQLPTYLVSRVARQHVKVVLSGDGGDEAFLGYERYGRKLAQWQRLSGVPFALRRPAAAVLRLAAATSRSSNFSGCGRRRRLAALLSCQTAADAYRLGVSMSVDATALLSVPVDVTRVTQLFADSSLDAQRNFSRIDCHTYLPGDILCKVDRASMAVSLEGRCPILDYRVVEHAFCYPSHLLKSAELGAKAPLKRLLYRYVPRELVDRPKRGFAVPLSEWLRGPLRDWGSALMNDAMDGDGLNQPMVRSLWHQLMQGDDQCERLAWAVINYRLWAKEYCARL